MPNTIPIDGNTDLQAQSNSLRFIELSGPSKVLDYARKPGPDAAAQKVNIATVQDISLDDEIPRLVLIATNPANDAVSIIAEQLAAGKQIVFHSRVFIEGAETEVLGFR